MLVRIGEKVQEVPREVMDEGRHGASRVTPASGLCASRGCPGDPPRGVSEANDALGGEGAASAQPRAGDRTRDATAGLR